MREILDYLRSRSEQGAGTVEDEIFDKVEFLEVMPEAAPVDEAAPPFPQPQAKGRRAIAGNYEIRYAYPVAYQGDAETVLILLVRDARRDPLDRPELRQRFVDLALTDARARSERSSPTEST